MSWRAAQLSVNVAFLALSGIAGCGSRGSAPGGGEPELEIVVVVDNLHQSNINVYLVRDGTRTHLGLVASQARATLPVPHDFLIGDHHEVRLVADAVGGGAFVSEPLLLRPGDTIELRVTHRLRNSWVTVQSR